MLGKSNSLEGCDSLERGLLPCAGVSLEATRCSQHSSEQLLKRYEDLGLSRPGDPRIGARWTTPGEAIP